MCVGLSSLLVLGVIAEIQFYLGAKVDAALTDGRADPLIYIIAILLGVADDNLVAAAPHQLIQSHIVEVAAVRQVHVLDESSTLPRSSLVSHQGANLGEAGILSPGSTPNFCPASSERRGFGIHTPSRTSNIVIKNAVAGLVW